VNAGSVHRVINTQADGSEFIALPTYAPSGLFELPLNGRQFFQLNPLQRLAYFSVPIASLLSVLTCWAIHKPMQLSWLAAIFGGFDSARVWHFWLMWIFVLFVIPYRT
jgi:hypothetical protein